MRLSPEEQEQIIKDTLSLIEEQLITGFSLGKMMILNLKRPDDISFINKNSPKSGMGVHRITIEFLKP